MSNSTKLSRVSRHSDTNMYLNKIFLYGNLTRDPEVRVFPSGGQLASFSIATNRIYRDKSGQRQEATEFHNIIAFGRAAELIAQYMKKGRPIFVEGRIQTRSWESEGQKKYRTEIVVENFQFGDGGNRNGDSHSNRSPTVESAVPENTSTQQGEGEIQYPSEEINPEDIPF